MKKLWKWLRLGFWTLVLIIAGLVMVMLFAANAGDEDLRAFGPYVLATAVTMLAWEKLLIIPNKKALQFQKFPLIRPLNFLALFLGFNISLILIISGSYTTLRGLTDYVHTPGGIDIVIPYFHAFVMFAGVCFVLYLFTNVPFIGVKNYFGNLFRFMKNYVSVFVVYQLAFILISFLCNALVMLISQGFETSKLAATGYFLYFADAENSGGIIGLASQGISGLTAASAYYVLSDLAYQSLKYPNEEHKFKTKLRYLLWSSDTKKLLIMTVVCILTMMVTNSFGGTFSVIFFLVSGIIWLVSMFLFLRETNFMMFLLNYAVLGLLEVAIPMPEFTGIVAVPLTLVTILLRVVLYSFTGMLMGYSLLAQEIVENKPDSEKTAIEKISISFGKASLLDAVKVGVGVVHAVSHPGETAKAAAVMAKDKIIEKINEQK